MIKIIVTIILGLTIGAVSTYVFFYYQHSANNSEYTKQILERQLKENQAAISQAALLNKDDKREEAKIILQNHLEKIKLSQEQVSVDKRLNEKSKSRIIEVLQKESSVINNLLVQLESDE